MDLAKIRKKAKAQDPAPGPEEQAAPETRAKGHSRRQTPKAQPAAQKAPVPEPRPPVPDAEPAPPRASEPAAPAVEVVGETHEPAEAAASSAAGEKLLIFDLAREKYAIPIHEIAQIIELPPTTPIPNAPDFLHGILSLRGKIIAVIDVGVRLGLRHQAPREGRKVVVLDMGADQFGLLVDGIDQVVEVDLSGLEPPPEGFRPVAQDFVEGVFHHKGKAVAFLNLPMFLAFEL